MSSVIFLRNVFKSYNHKLIFRDLSLELSSGTLTLIAGPNGAGKSTLLHMMAGLARPTKGTIQLQSNASVGFLGHASSFYPELTAEENLAFWARINNISGMDTDDVLKRTGLSAHAGTIVGFFSRGMAQRLNFARILLLKPALILLDEPFTGIDSDYAKILRQEIINLKMAGTAIAMVSHALTTDIGLADMLAVIKNHRLEYYPQPENYLSLEKCSGAAAI